MSSFRPAARRAQPAQSTGSGASSSAPDSSSSDAFGPGIKTSGGGSVLSTGLNDLDRLFGGGAPLGSLILVFEDDWGEHAATLLKYFMAEGVAWRQQVLHLHDGRRDTGLLDQLPKLVGAAGGREDTCKSTPKAEDTTELKIAWQYKRYVKAPAAEVTTQAATVGGTTQPVVAPRMAAWAHRFDISKPCQPEVLQRAASQSTGIACDGRGALQAVREAAREFVASIADVAAGKASAADKTSQATAPQAAIPTLSPRSVGRIAVHALGDGAWRDLALTDEQAEQDIVTCVLALRAHVHDSRCVAMVTVATGAHSPSLVPRLTHLAHIALHARSISDDAQLVRLSTEPQSCCGLVRLSKFAPPNVLPLPVAEPMLLMIRHRRTRLALVPIEIDPDAETAMADAEASLTESAASLLCAQPQPSGAALDF